MRDELPAWVAGYIGIPWTELGRDRAGCDCWGLVRLVLAERFGLVLPSHDTIAWRPGCDEAALAAEIAAELARTWREVPAGEARPGDMVSVRIMGQPVHVGLLVAPGRMLHVRRATHAAVVRLDTPAWRHRVLGTYRPLGGAA